MNNLKGILTIAQQTIDTQSEAIKNLGSLLNKDFALAINIILESNGRVIVTGIGKSALIASKIVATFNSTGTPAVFMHAADAIHGDLGTIQDEDVVICVSKSGNTPEIKLLIPLLKRGNNKLIGITGNTDSYLAQQSDATINSYVEKEACPNNLAPTTSTTAQLVLGDAIAVCLLKLKGFSSEDFANYHPGGSLGKKLYLRVADLVANNAIPAVQENSKVKEVIVEISEKMLGATAVLNGSSVVGVVTDGDIRRMLNLHDNIGLVTAKDIMTATPKTISSEVLAVKALDVMQTNGISQLLVVDGDEYKGIVHLHNLIKEGIL